MKISSTYRVEKTNQLQWKSLCILRLGILIMIISLMRIMGNRRTFGPKLLPFYFLLSGLNHFFMVIKWVQVLCYCLSKQLSLDLVIQGVHLRCFLSSLDLQKCYRLFCKLPQAYYYCFEVFDLISLIIEKCYFEQCWHY